MAEGAQSLTSALPGYEVLGQLGRGGMGEVLSARHIRLDRQVAIKRLPVAFARDEAVRERFGAEARLLASLNHPHIVPVYDYVEQDGLCLLVMEALPKGTVWDRFTGEGLTLRTSCAVVVTTCTALSYAHEHQVLHRDIKPENLMFDAENALKVTDFGIAQVLGGDETLATVEGAIIGTPAYMAPEQAAGQPVGPVADVYAVATMLYELASARLPFDESGGASGILEARISRDPIPLLDVAPQVPPGLAEVVMAGLARDPADRPESAEAFGLAVGRAAADAWGPDWVSQAGIRVMSAGLTSPSTQQVTGRTLAGNGAPAVARNGVDEAARGTRVGGVGSPEDEAARGTRVGGVGSPEDEAARETRVGGVGSPEDEAARETRVGGVGSPEDEAARETRVGGVGSPEDEAARETRVGGVGSPEDEAARETRVGGVGSPEDEAARETRVGGVGSPEDEAARETRVGGVGSPEDEAARETRVGGVGSPEDEAARETRVGGVGSPEDEAARETRVGGVGSPEDEAARETRVGGVGFDADEAERETRVPDEPTTAELDYADLAVRPDVADDRDSVRHGAELGDVDPADFVPVHEVLRPPPVPYAAIASAVLAGLLVLLIAVIGFGSPDHEGDFTDGQVLLNGQDVAAGEPVAVDLAEQVQVEVVALPDDAEGATAVELRLFAAGLPVGTSTAGPLSATGVGPTDFGARSMRVITGGELTGDLRFIDDDGELVGHQEFTVEVDQPWYQTAAALGGLLLLLFVTVYATAVAAPLWLGRRRRSALIALTWLGAIAALTIEAIAWAVGGTEPTILGTVLIAALGAVAGAAGGWSLFRLRRRRRLLNGGVLETRRDRTAGDDTVEPKIGVGSPS